MTIAQQQAAFRHFQRDRVLDYVQEHPGSTCSQIADGTGMRYDNVYAFLVTLFSQGHVRRQHAGFGQGRGIWHWYARDTSVLGTLVLR